MASAVGLAALIAACSSSSPSDLFAGGVASSSGTPGTSSSGGPSSSSGGVSSGGIFDAGSSGGIFDAGSSGGIFDAGADARVTPDAGVNAFTGAPAFTKCKATRESNNPKHIGVLVDSDPAGNNCLNCHVAGGLAAAFPMGFAGTIYGDVAASKPIGPGVEVRVRDNTGAAVTTCTDNSGNFFAPAFTTPSFARQMQAGVRSTGGRQALMPGTVKVGACNSAGCHDDGQRIYLR
jgi:hypothetical protein